ncbi:MAG: primosomal protein N' [Firmicutes bacterium]|nr:primosomal protein N' [Bacillota bacterium]
MSAPLIYAGVIVDLKVEAVDRIFQYSIPPEIDSLSVGHRVLVPFGPRRLEGYVVQLSSQLEIESSQLRSIIRLLDPAPIILPSLVELAKWMRNRYVGLLSEALQYMLPPGSRYGRERVGAKYQQVVTLKKPNPDLRPQATAQKRVLEVLKQNPRLLAADLVEQAQARYGTLKSLESRGIISITSERLERTISWDAVPDPSFKLNLEQEEALRVIREEREGQKRPVLIHGVTSSGKTEIYLQIIKEVIEQGQQALVLVPEIALTPQTVNRFGTRFGRRISVLHSALSPGERFDQWWKIYRGEVDVVIGARSAVFAPVPNLGLIVLDEEHEGSYKQEEGTVRYQTGEVAIKRCELVGAQVLLGSATPALESYHRALQGHYRLVQLTKRVEKRPLPAVEVVDMRQEFEQGNRSVFSKALKTGLDSIVNTGKQAIILLNRRGFSSFVLCRECGHVLRCPNCHVSLTYHRADDRLHCHYCPHKEPLPNLCPQCASKYLRQFGVGTEQVVEALGRELPQLKVLRLDADTTRRKGAHNRILKQFSQGQAQVLVGTQMVAKGLDFPNVTLVGVLSADLALNFPDLRSSERTFQLLTQVAGRSGRGRHPGKVIIQSYEPRHFSILCAQKHDYLGFYRQEITFRRGLGYPPFRRLTRILCSGPEKEAAAKAKKIQHYLLDNGFAEEDILGPHPAPLSRLQGRFRWHLVLKSDFSLSPLLRKAPKSTSEVRVIIDVDPLFLL